MKTCRSGRHQYEPVKKGDRGCSRCRQNRQQEWYKANAELHRERRRQRQEKYPGGLEKLKADRRKYYNANREKCNEMTRKWQDANPEKTRENRRRSCARRRAQKQGVDTTPVTRQHLSLLFEAQSGCCRYCHTPLGPDKHLDHRTPLSRGGPHAPHNVCWSCPACNLHKHTRTEQEFSLDKARISPYHASVVERVSGLAAKMPVPKTVRRWFESSLTRHRTSHREGRESRPEDGADTGTGFRGGLTTDCSVRG